MAEKADKQGLIMGLQSIESVIQKHPKTLKGLWFRFFKNDSLATTIQDLYYSIGSNVNDGYIRECMQIAIDNPKEFQIYYS